MYCLNSKPVFARWFSSLCLPDEDCVIDKSFPKYSATPHRVIAQDTVCCSIVVMNMLA